MNTPLVRVAAQLQTSRASRLLAVFGGMSIRRQCLLLMIAVAVPLLGLSALCFSRTGVGQTGDTTAAALAAASLVAFALWLIAGVERRLREAIDAVASSAAAFARGEKHRVSCHGPAELRAVAAHWNAMLDTLDATQAESRAWTKELEVLIGSVGSAVFSVAPNGEKILFASEQAREIYGVPAEILCSSPFLWRELIHPSDVEAVANLTRQLRRSGRFDVEYRIRRVGGGVRWVRHRGRIQVDVNGGPQRITGVVTDISRRKERELRLQASETRLAGLIRTSMEGIVTVDEKRCVVLYNPAAERIFARPSREVIGQPVDQLLSAAFRARFLLLDEADGGNKGAGEPHAPLIVGGVRGDGSEFSMEATLARHAVGEQRFVTATLRDITERLAAETRLQQLSSAVEQSPVSIQITDIDFRICYVNKHFCEVTGYAPEEVLGKSTSIFKSGGTPESEYLRLRAAIASGGEWRGEFRNRRKDGSLYWELARIMPITDSDGTITHFLALKEDVTEKKAMEERERQRQEQLTHSARLILLGEMSSSLAHEVNQPLMAIAGYSSICSRVAKDCPEALVLLKKMDAQVTRAGEIVWRMRDFSRRRSERESIDIPTLIFSVMDWVGAEAERYGITLDTSGVRTPLPEIRADRLQIEQVLLNLLQNAFDALRDVDTARRVIVAAEHAHGSNGIVVSVQDTGRGVPAQVALDVFQAFFTTKPTGLGLGLSISRSIIEDHGGSLWYTAAATGGTSFLFSLPADPFPARRPD